MYRRSIKSRRWRKAPGLAAAALLLGCAPEPRPALPFFGGYRAPDDPCQRIGENAQTNRYLDDAADLVGCPADYRGLAEFQARTQAEWLGTLDGYALFSVPRR
ncbi:MAG: hypothetical protein HKN63_12260 [Rhodobacteraceae bacterium]|nr:hypothetical protein [Paracoccaceae bacterium]